MTASSTLARRPTSVSASAGVLLGCARVRGSSPPASHPQRPTLGGVPAPSAGRGPALGASWPPWPDFPVAWNWAARGPAGGPARGHAAPLSPLRWRFALASLGVGAGRTASAPAAC